MACCNGCDNGTDSGITTGLLGDDNSNDQNTLASWGIWPPEIWFVVSVILFLLLLSHGSDRR